MLSRYEVGRVLARGVSGVVFLARDPKEDRTVAIKVLRSELSKDDKAVRRLMRAMKTMLPIHHENLVALYGAGRNGPHCWIAMEYVEGESLTEIRRIGVEGKLNWRQAFHLAVQIARALEVAHKHRIIHRNITPQNILIRSSDNLVKLGDLMLAKALEGTLAEQITRPGELAGKLPYMSPERTHGLTRVDGRSDIYSLGPTVYALLTGRRCRLTA